MIEMRPTATFEAGTRRDIWNPLLNMIQLGFKFDTAILPITRS